MDYGLNFLERGPVFDGRDHPYPAAALLAIPLSSDLKNRPALKGAPLDIENPQNLFPSRTLNLGLAALTLIFFALWIKTKFGVAMGLLTLAAGTLDPGWLAQARFFTTDILHASGLLLSALAIGAHAQTRNKLPLALAAMGFALACSAKFSGLLLAPTALLIYMIYEHRRLENATWSRALGIAIIPAASISFFGFVLFVLLFELHAFLGLNEFGAGLNHLIKGTESFAEVRSSPRGTFLMGSYYPGGTLLYFPLLIAAKTPLAMLVLICATKGKALFQESKAVFPELALLAGTYLLVAILSKVNLGYRHLTPILPALWFLTAAGAWRILNTTKLKLAAPALGLVLLFECLMVHPNYLPYTNLAFGGERRAHLVAVDSATDWGQDLPALSRYLRLNRDIETKLDLAYFGSANPAKLGIHARWRPCGLLGAPAPRSGGRAACEDPAELLAISATCLQGAAGGNTQDSCYEWLRDRPPDEILGGSILIYRNLRSKSPTAPP